MIYKLTLHGRKYNVTLDYSGRYPNGRQAIELIDAKNGESILVATVNIPDYHLLKGEVIIKDYSENEGVLKFLINAKIVSGPKRCVLTGFVYCPVVDLLFNPERIQWETKVVELIEELLECSTSDAQSLMDANPNTIEGAYNDQLTTQETASLITSLFHSA